MNKFILIIAVSIIAMFFGNAVFAAENYLHTPETIQFNNEDYTLSWSAHPSDNLYSQEYLRSGDSADHFEKMLMVSFLEGVDVKSAVGIKLQELNESKKTDPLVNYQVMKSANGQDYMIDFMISDKATTGSVTIVERNVYYYKPVQGNEGPSGVKLFAISTRAYDKNITPFIEGLETTKSEMPNAIMKAQFPQISLTQ